MQENQLHHLDPLFKTELSDRVLYCDGDSVVSPSLLIDRVLKSQPVNGMYVDGLTDQIRQYNKLVSSEDQIKVKSGLSLSCDFGSWNIPEEFVALNIDDYIMDKFEDECKNTPFTTQDILMRRSRISAELDIFNEKQLNMLLRTLIYIINTLYENDVVWGVGRGSCVSSYVLYLIGVHDVDSVLYDLDFSDFIK